MTIVIDGVPSLIPSNFPHLPPLYDPLISSDGEMWTTETERENNIFVNLLGTQSSVATNYHGLIDLSNGDNTWPHPQDCNAIHLSYIRFTTDKAPAARGSVSIGVITRISAVNADISYVGSLSFLENDTVSTNESVNLAPSQLKCNVEAGKLKYFKAQVKELNVAVVNTANPLPFGYAFVPAVGDIIMRIQTTAAATLHWTVGLGYHAH